MINTIRYGGTGKVIKNGKEIEVPISPKEILNFRGPFLQVTITHPQITQEYYKQKNKDIPSVNVMAIIDTGAFSSVITPDVADKLELVHTGYQTVTSVQDQQKRPVFYGRIGFPWGMGKEIPLVSCPLTLYDCLIGRDILRHWHFTYNGDDGSITICD